MSPFSHLLHDLRVRYGLRQADLAERVGYEQSYISALEVGLKGPPTDEFVERFSAALSLTTQEHEELCSAAMASQRKLVIDPDAPPDIYWLLHDLRDEVQHLTAAQVRLIRDVLALRGAKHELREPIRRLKRKRKEEATM
ncbi:MAG: helix-turn-helix transcriptional regulator [Burkholderiaceae bacterium]|nr:helix-turn-helix transcriptional regulator [Burkholderiaceae bacterium]